jgi:DNA transformation protein
MPLSEEFLDYVVDLFREWDGVSTRKMFGGAGVYRDGTMFGLVANDVLYLKVDDSNRTDYTDLDCGPFKPSPNKATTMSYYEVPPDILESPTEIIDWAKKSLQIQTT